MRCRERSPAQACEFLKAGALRSFKSSPLSAWMSVVTWLPRAFWQRINCGPSIFGDSPDSGGLELHDFGDFFSTKLFPDLKTARSTSKLQQQQLEVNVSIWDHGISPWRSTWDLLPQLQRLGELVAQLIHL